LSCSFRCKYFQVRIILSFATMGRKPSKMAYFRKYLYFVKKGGTYFLSYYHHVIEHPFLHRTVLMWKKIRPAFRHHNSPNITDFPKKAEEKRTISVFRGFGPPASHNELYIIRRGFLCLIQW